MGILDDAIREHLDLKRRLGAEDEEIHKLESEAFGPPSRPGDPDFAEQEGAAEQAEPQGAEPEAAETPPPAPVAESAVQPSEPAESEPEPPALAEESPVPVEPEPEADSSTALFDHSLEEPESSTALEPEPPTGTDEQPLPEPEPVAEPPIESFDTVEHHFEGAVEETGEGEVVEGELTPEPDQGTGEEDVLEETPEFLRDQPEDDELWFEQGEPKDFDF